jgi:hypothetical protein
MPGPVPKKASQRRRRNTPVSQGEAKDMAVSGAVEQPELGFETSSALVDDMWAALGKSVEGQFFSHADWQRARFELWFVNSLFASGRVGAQAWQAVQAGLSALLISPADKRRVGIELKKVTADPDEDAAVAQLDDYRAALQSS